MFDAFRSSTSPFLQPTVTVISRKNRAHTPSVDAAVRNLSITSGVTNVCLALPFSDELYDSREHKGRGSVGVFPKSLGQQKNNLNVTSDPGSGNRALAATTLIGSTKKNPAFALIAIRATSLTTLLFV